jgi:hypothetical protein
MDDPGVALMGMVRLKPIYAPEWKIDEVRLELLNWLGKKGTQTLRLYRDTIATWGWAGGKIKRGRKRTRAATSSEEFTALPVFERMSLSLVGNSASYIVGTDNVRYQWIDQGIPYKVRVKGSTAAGAKENLRALQMNSAASSVNSARTLEYLKRKYTRQASVQAKPMYTFYVPYHAKTTPGQLKAHAGGAYGDRVISRSRINWGIHARLFTVQIAKIMQATMESEVQGVINTGKLKAEAKATTPRA